MRRRFDGGCGRRPAAAPQRKDRLRAFSEALVKKQGGHRDRRWRFHRLGRFAIAWRHSAPRDCCVIENSEPALYAVTEALATYSPQTMIEGRSRGYSGRERLLPLYERV